ncbi:hypothetical protein N7462_005134 [Penicillium macrosclerotiorum]|uniref:uncharacterized protein n=1 Tax=Penicillium macrosclerotiorum TaxID=303699 RepID=UPI0025485185|nr:uncharacterized protein N7462_005134 [Penicillium macrosclerotiorum]KAJ5690742.1 hypothetical protein N7462_005134 [Penicillium macrosclerotiorum]
MASTDYVFTRDYLDNNRINLQHYLTVQLFGYHIHPSIPITNKDLRIADVGTGTGIWLTDLSTTLPKSARLDALDISFDAAPLPEMLPSNFSLHYWNIKEDVPEHLIGVYDIVHIRFFAFVLRESEVKAAIDNLLKLLKPGGYLQWTDIDVSSIRLEILRPGIEIVAQTKLMELFQGNDDRMRSSWLPSLPKLFAEHGLVDVQFDEKEAPSHLALAFHECGMLAPEVLSRNKTTDEKTVQMLKETLDQAVKETRAGSYLTFTRSTVVGRKNRENRDAE